MVGIVGKPNTGKSTFFNATTMASVPVASYPFTTIEPNVGVAYVRKKCVCEELGVVDNPKNSVCIDHNRFIPFKLVDTAGLVPGAWEGRGLGNEFLDKISRADALIHVVDAAGATDLEGMPVATKSHDPLEDVDFLVEELVRWFDGILDKDWHRMARKAETNRESIEYAIYDKLTGLNFSLEQIQEALGLVEADPCRAVGWKQEDRLDLTRNLIRFARPILIAANKIDIPEVENNIKRLIDAGNTVFSTSAVSELVLRKAAEKEYIRYLAGDADFRLLDSSGMTDKQVRALEAIREKVLKRFGSTGVQQILNYAVFDVLRQIVVYPVANADRLSDGSGNVLPDAYLLRSGSTVKNLAEKIHSEIAEKILFAIDARTKMRLGPSHPLKDGDVIEIVTAARKQKA